MAKSNTNVILFPLDRIVNPVTTALQDKKKPRSVKQIKDIVHFQKVEKVNQIMDTMTPLLASGLAAYGIGSVQESEFKQAAFMFEALRSMLYHHVGLEHPIQDLAEKLFEMKDGQLNILNLNVTMKEKKDE